MDGLNTKTQNVFERLEKKTDINQALDKCFSKISEDNLGYEPGVDKVAREVKPKHYA